MNLGLIHVLPYNSTRLQLDTVEILFYLMHIPKFLRFLKFNVCYVSTDKSP